MPVNILLTFAIGSALGWILVKITRTPQHLSGLVIACCSAGAYIFLPDRLLCMMISSVLIIFFSESIHTVDMFCTPLNSYIYKHIRNC